MRPLARLEDARVALQWEIVASANCVVVTWDQRFDLDEYMAFYRRFAEAEEFRPGMCRLYDLRRTRLSLSLDELYRLTARIQQEEHKHGERRVVFLVESDLNFGIVRQFIATAAPLAVDYHMTRDLAEAKRLSGLATDYTMPGDR